MSFKTLDKPGMFIASGIPVRGGYAQISEASIHGKWLNLLYSILQRVAPLVVKDAFYIELEQLPVYANNAAAIAGGKVAGNLYRTGADPDPVCVVH